MNEDKNGPVVAETGKTDSAYKDRVMAVLANAPLNMLSNKEMLWAASNLPDTKIKGTYATSLSFSGDIDHTIENIYEVFKITDADLKEFATVMRDSVKHQHAQPEGEQRNSVAIQYILEKLGSNPKFFTSLVIKVMGDAAASQATAGLSGMHVLGGKGLGGLLAILKKLAEGRGGKDNDDDIDDLLRKLGKE